MGSGPRRLVIVEGIMGSGKSETARWIAGQLQAAGRDAVAITERVDPHPVRATDEASLAAHCKSLADIARPLDPLLVYFRQEDVDHAIRAVCAERGDEWIKYQVDWKLAFPYCRRRGLQGLEGLVALYQDYRAMTDTLFAQSDMDKLSIDNSGHAWDSYHREIMSRLH